MPRPVLTSTALGSRARPGTWANPLLLVAVAGAFGLQLAAVYVPFLRDLLGTQPLTLLDLLIVSAASTLGYAAIRLDRIVHPSKHPTPAVAGAPPNANQQ